MADKKKKGKAPAITEDEDVKNPEGENDEGAGATEEGGEELDLDGKKKGIKPLFIIIGAVVLLIGAGAGVYFSGMLDPLLGKDKGKEETKKEDAKVEIKKDKDGKIIGSPFMELPDLIVNLSGTQGQPRYLKLKVQLELENADDQSAIEAIAPRVIDHFQTYLRELRIADLRGSAGIYRLRQELLARVNDAADPVKVKDVLFQEILIQ